MIVIALSSLRYKSNTIKGVLFSLFILLYILMDVSYLNQGADRLYMNDSKKIATNFKQAIDDSTIRPNTSMLYVWERKRDSNTEDAIRWSLGDGYLFEFYGVKKKKLTFVDSIYQRGYPFSVSSFKNFNQNTEQIVYNHNSILEITREYLRDSLKSFWSMDLNALTVRQRIKYDQHHLLIANDDFSRFSVNGFHDQENGIRWTNGNASIGFLADFTVKDSLCVEMNTYLPPVCQDVKPEISLLDQDKKFYKPVYQKKEGDKFIYKFYFSEPAMVQKITLISDTIDAGADIRVLSFPFISLELKK
jgi:hypothetical protein